MKQKQNKHGEKNIGQICLSERYIFSTFSEVFANHAFEDV